MSGRLEARAGVRRRRVASSVLEGGSRLGMWAWLLQRVSALGLVAVLAIHLSNPFVRSVQFLLLGLVLLHLGLGLRAMLLDAGLAARWHQLAFGVALLAGAAVLALFWWWRWY